MLIQFQNQPVHIKKPKKLFISYAHREKEIFDCFVEALFPLKKEALVDEWHDRMLKAGDDWSEEINNKIEEADVILFLISNAFLSSNYCNTIEVTNALKRHRKNEVCLIPVIVENNSSWYDHPLAKIEALPPYAKPIKSFETIEEGVNKTIEKLRFLLLDENFTLDDNNTGLSEVLHIELVSSREIYQQEIEDIVSNLVDIAKDHKLLLIAYKSRITLDGKFNIVLILNSTGETFSKLEKYYDAGKIKSICGFKVTKISRAIGSTMEVSSVIYESDMKVDESYFHPETNILYPSESMGKTFLEATPNRLNGFTMKDLTDFDSISILFNSVNDKIYKLEELLDLFHTSLYTNEKDWWVNLSAFEDNRVLPNELNNTRLGFEFLSMDVALKHFTGSLLHPDTQTGHKFWLLVFEEMLKEKIPLTTPIETFQKVWIEPETAQVYDSHEQKDEMVLGGIEFKKDSLVVLVTEASLSVKTEWDFSFFKNQKSDLQRRAEEIYMNKFNEFLVPIIYKEVNRGQLFQNFRVVYLCQILATFFKTKFNKHKDYNTLIKSKNDFVITSIGSNLLEDKKTSDGKMIFGNNHFYKMYLTLFKEGLSKCVRSFNINNHLLTRHFFSGGTDFRFIKEFVRKNY